jgi:hypothetical protein
MYHSISVWTSEQNTSEGGRNSWASWGLIPSSRPFITPPTTKTYYQDVPYRNGKIDLSTLGIAEPVFENRTGSIAFNAVNYMVDGYLKSKKRTNDGNAFTPLMMEDGAFADWDWLKTYNAILNYIHGERRKLVLEDDPSYYYFGRLEVAEPSSEQHFTSFTINYDFEPFKIQRFSTREAWLWDAIDFEENHDILGLLNLIAPKKKTFSFEVNNQKGQLHPVVYVHNSHNASYSKYYRSVIRVKMEIDGEITKTWYFASTNKSKNEITADNVGKNLIATYGTSVVSTPVSAPIDDFMVPPLGKATFYIKDVSDTTTRETKYSFDYRLEGL